ncbi:hypothetical protein [Phascolarctobacterium sp.]|uniref:hypothetical protein n=1 Tax=Phascolarctobacterium sp. TaxID=2049039 RepID=UPI00386FABDB
MQNVKLAELVGGALQEKFQNSFAKVLENMLDINTPYKARRSITIKIAFDQNEQRDDVKAHISVSETLAPQGAIETSFSIGKDLETDEIIVEEYGKQIKGQMSFLDKEQKEVVMGSDLVDRETGEVVGNVIDLRAKQA